MTLKPVSLVKLVLFVLSTPNKYNQSIVYLYGFLNYSYFEVLETSKMNLNLKWKFEITEDSKFSHYSFCSEKFNS